MMRNLVYIIIIIFTLSAIQGFSQGGSNYSIFGIGDISLNNSAAYDGLAGTSIAFPVEHAISSLNPALWSKVTKTRMTTGYVFTQHLTGDIKDNALYQNNGRLSGLSALFSIDTSLGLSVSVALQPYSNVNYLISETEPYNFGNISFNRTTEYQGNGGLSTGYLGASINILNNLSFGATAFATFGVINTKITSTFDDQYLYSSVGITENRFSGSGFRLGILYEPIEGLYAGAFIENYSKMELDRETTYISAVLVDTSFSTLSELTLPNSFGVGASYLTGKFRMGADFKLTMLNDLNFNKGPLTKYKDLMQFSIAVSRLRNRSLGAKYLDKVTYNFGLGFRELYFKINNSDINEFYASFGMNFPLVGSSMIDASFTFGTRGEKTDILLHEYFGRLSIDISIGETWFKPFKREY